MPGRDRHTQPQATNAYYDMIVAVLTGQTPELSGFRERLDWAGSGTVLELYDQTSGEDREVFVRAMGQIIETETESPSVIAQLIHLASSLNVTQVEPSIRRLESSPLAAQEPIRSAIANYLVYRQLARTEEESRV